ncbi:hypothetical protein Syn7502_00266 [Synechococcus sp. PCC 7502]|uniref:hypothetical protein n=1 Tax=Synechococcus sp. PCC 7502 TaxID=1173263 RepID=UPI00029FDDAC|nr:hypothetical protein [Synechococcus sp. PCC 7502]AFY72433.1 hypothetical protein Syn7502_00266 [Synechococcus sp. PCC 7502]
MNIGDRLEFSFWEAGCLIWLACKDLGGLSYEELDSLIQGNNPEKAKQFIFEHKAYLAMDLYQDDGYTVRVVFGDLNQQEHEEWVARVRWHLNIPSGNLVVSGSLGSEDEFEEMPSVAETEDTEFLECYVEVPPSQYQVEVYSYAPGDLSTGWEQIIGDEDSWCKPSPDIERESLQDYFTRTRFGEAPPPWIAYEIADPEAKTRELYEASITTKYINFVIRLSPVLENIPKPELDRGCLNWEFRKPEQCPLGIPSIKQKQ